MERDFLIEILEDAGLSPYKADAYVTTLERGSGTVSDIAEASEVPDPRIYDVLRDLEERGYVETYEQDSLNVRAHSPENVLEDLRTRANRFSKAAAEIERRWERPSIEDNAVSLVKRFDTVLDHACEAIRSSESQVQVSVALDRLPEVAPALRTARDEGVYVELSVYGGRDDGGDFAADDVADLCSVCRRQLIPSPFIVIVDRSITCFSPHPGSINEYGVLVEDRSHTYVFHWFFLTHMWDPWERVHGGEREEFERKYADLRYCIRDLEPLFEAGREIRVAIQGIDIAGRERREIEGVVSDVTTTRSREFGTEGSRTPVAAYAGVATLSIDDGDRVIDVGGWGATLEEIEANRIKVLDVE